MAVATPTLFRTDTDETEDRRYDTERDQKHDSNISQMFRHLMDPNARLDDFYDESGAVKDMAPAPAPVQEAVETPAQQAYTAPAPAQQAYTAPAPAQQAYTAPAPQQTFQAGPQLVQSARVTSDLFRVKDPAPAAQAAPAQEAFDYNTAAFEVVSQSTSFNPIAAPAAAAATAEEENEDLVPTMTTRQYKTREDGRIENIGAAKKSSIMLSKRDKILMFSIIGIVAVLFVLIIVNAAIISGLNSQVSDVEQEYNAVYSEYAEIDSQIQDTLTDLETNMDQYAADLGMTK
ncbi:MAG: hypothetical protein LUD51_00635 [Clostridia bacterium]|nr:hypothetical protein [Clostridia bacterium]